MCGENIAVFPPYPNILDGGPFESPEPGRKSDAAVLPGEYPASRTARRKIAHGGVSDCQIFKSVAAGAGYTRARGTRVLFLVQTWFRCSTGAAGLACLRNVLVWVCHLQVSDLRWKRRATADMGPSRGSATWQRRIVPARRPQCHPASHGRPFALSVSIVKLQRLPRPHRSFRFVTPDAACRAYHPF